MMEIDQSRLDRLLLKNLMDNLADHIYFKDMASRFVLVNKASAEWQGYQSTEEVIGKSDFDRYKPADAQRMLEDEQRIIETGEPMVGIEEYETRQNGTIAWVSSSKMPLRNDRGEIIGTFGISRDITDHKEAEFREQEYAEDVRAIKESMEDDLRMAADLQRMFFPRNYPVFPPGCAPDESRVLFHHLALPNSSVSGDFCAVKRISKTKCAILQCDVMGHGIRSALVTALIFAMVEEEAHKEHNPGRFLERMNTLLMPVLRRDDTFLYATACYLVCDTETGMLHYANAGHPVPLHVRPCVGKTEWLMDDPARRGPALAICEGITFESFEKQLSTGDSVIMYTDGLYEVPGADGSEFGEERLLAAAGRFNRLPLAELFPALLDEVRCFSTEHEFDDDICMVGFTCREIGEEGA